MPCGGHGESLRLPALPGLRVQPSRNPFSSVFWMPLQSVNRSLEDPCCVPCPRPPSWRPRSSQLCPEPLDTERGGEHGRRGQGGDGPHVVPSGPLRDVLVPTVRRIGLLGKQCREAVVERYVARDRYSDGAD